MVKAIWLSTGWPSSRRGRTRAAVTAQRTEQRDSRADEQQLRSHLAPPRRIEAALRVEARQEAVDAALVARVGERRGVGGGSSVCRRGADALGDRTLHRERVGDFAKRGLDRAFIARERGVALCFAHRYPGAAAPGVEDRRGHIATRRPAERSAVEQAGQRVAGKAEQPGQRNRREQLRARNADISN